MVTDADSALERPKRGAFSAKKLSAPVSGFLRREPWLVAFAGATAVTDAAASIIHHLNLATGLDLALADQAVWHYSRFEAPFSSILGKDILGDHFSPLVAVLTPLYWLWSDPRMLLIAQSALIATSVIPVFLFAEPRIGRAGAYLVAGAYAAFWGLQVGVLFDFHELAFAPLLIALAILLADKALQAPSPRRWTAFWLVIVLLLLVKEDLSMLIVFIGLYVLTRREVRHGIALMVVGILWYELVTRVFIPDLSGGAGYAHWTYQQLGKNLPDALWALLKAPWRVLTIGFSSSQKAHTMLALLAPFLFLSLGSRLFILALPLLAERFLSTNSLFWGTHFQYSLSIAPVLAMAATAGLANLATLLPQRHRRRLSLAAAATMLVTSLAITYLGTSDSVPRELTSRSFYSSPADSAAAHRAVRHVPADASLATADVILPHASERQDIRMIVPATVGRTAYILTNVTHEVCCDTGNGTFATLGKVTDMDLARMTPIYYDAGWLVARRPPVGQSPTNGALSPMTQAAAAKLKRRVNALSAQYASLYPCYVRWRATDPTASACFASAVGTFKARERRAAASIRAGLPSLRGGCRDLALASLAAIQRQVLDLEPLAPAAASPHRSALVLALLSAQTDANNLDLSGQPERFLVLCSARE